MSANFTSSKEREKHENLSNLFSIVMTTEYLERAYIRDAVTAQEYTSACQTLISQFKTLMDLTDIKDVAKFMNDFNVSCPAAIKRLVEIGVPATIEHASTAPTQQTAKHVAETVQIFITLIDALRLNMTAVDHLHPLLSDLMQALNKVTLPSNYQGKLKAREWLITLNKLKASDELTQEQTRQLAFDLESALAEFHRNLT